MSCGLVILAFFVIDGITGVSGQSDTLSPSSIAGISCVLGFITLVVVLSVACRCYRKRQLQKFKERNKRLKSIEEILREHANESIRSEKDDPLPFPEEFDSAIMVINHGPTQKYTDWRTGNGGSSNNTYYMKQSQVQQQYMPVTTVNQQQQRQYVTTVDQQRQYQPMTLDRQYVIRQSNRSSSPVRTPRERGRSTTRQFVYNQQPAATMRAQNVEVVQNRSKSAPPVNRGTVRRVVAREPVVFTKSHFMAIRKPGSKKYLLPPTKMYTEAKQTNRTLVVERNVTSPAPRQQRVTSGGVYHVQYNPETANIVRSRGHTISGDHHRMVSAPTTPRYYQQQQPQQQQEVVFNRRSIDTKQPIRLATYTPKIIQGTQLTTENRTHTWSAQNGGVANGTTVWSSEDLYASPQTLNSAAFKHSTLSLPVQSSNVGLHSNVGDNVYHVEYRGDDKMIKGYGAAGDLVTGTTYGQDVFIQNDDVITGSSYHQYTHGHGEGGKVNYQQYIDGHGHGGTANYHQYTQGHGQGGKATHVWSSDKGWMDEDVNWSTDRTVLNTRYHAGIIPSGQAAVKTHDWSESHKVDPNYTIVDFVETESNHASKQSNTYDHITHDDLVHHDEQNHALNDLDDVLEKSNSPKSSSPPPSSHSGDK